MPVTIHGKEYATVNERLVQFWNDNPEGSIVTEVLKFDKELVLVKTSIKKYESDYVSATGHAWEDRASSKINATSYVENGETSSVGRALAILGYDITTSVASAEEVKQAISQQGEL